MQTYRQYTVLNILALFFAILVNSACVSDTLSTVDTTSQPLATQKPPTYDPILRARAVEDIRLKAEQQGSGELTSPYLEANGPNEPFTPAEQAKMIAELETASGQNEVVITDAELSKKQQSIKELRKKANSHYGDAINQIKN